MPCRGIHLKSGNWKTCSRVWNKSPKGVRSKKDALQETIALVRKSISDFPLQFKNFRD